MEDGQGDALCNDELVPRRRERCKDIARIIFGPTLHDQQVESIYTIFYEERDLLCTSCQNGFGENLIFQLLSFYVLSNRCYYSYAF